MGSDYEKCYRQFIQVYLDSCESKGLQIGAFLLEPLMLGAGGLKFIDPLYQKVCIQECRLRGIPIVYDEVRYRTRTECSKSIFNCIDVILCILTHGDGTSR